MHETGIPPVDETGAEQKQDSKLKTFFASRRNKVIAVVVAVALVLGAGGTIYAVRAHNERVAEQERIEAQERAVQRFAEQQELEEAVTELNEAAVRGREAVSMAQDRVSGDDEVLRDDLAELLNEVGDPAGPSAGLRDTTNYEDLDVVVATTVEVDDSAAELKTAVLAGPTAELTDAIETGQKVLNESEGRVNDELLIVELRLTLDGAQELLGYEDITVEDIEGVIGGVKQATGFVEESVDDFEEAEARQQEIDEEVQRLNEETERQEKQRQQQREEWRQEGSG